MQAENCFLVENKANKNIDTLANQRIIAFVPRKHMTKDQVVATMRKQQGDRTNRAYAEELEISPSYLCDIYLGKREPGESVLSKLGLTRKVLYEELAV